MIDTALDAGAIHLPIAEIFFEIIEVSTPQDSTCEILAADGLSSVNDEDPIPLDALFEQLEGGGCPGKTRTDDDDIKVGLIVHRHTSGNTPTCDPSLNFGSYTRTREIWI